MIIHETTLELPDGRVLRYALEGADRLSAVKSWTIDGELATWGDVLAVAAMLERKEAAPTSVGAASLLTITGQTVVTISGVNGDPVVHVADEPARRTETKGIGQALAVFFALTHSQLSAPVNSDLRAGPAAVPDCARGGDEPG